MVAQATIVLASWILSSMYPESGVISMLTSESVRWFVGNCARIVATPLLTYLLLVGMTYGMVRCSGVLATLHKSGTDTKPAATGNEFFKTFSHRLGIRVASVVFAIFVISVLLLTCLPHAVLLNSHGSIINSSFSRGLIPMLCFGISLASAVYGICSSNINSFESFANAFTYGISRISPLLLLYALSAQLYFMVLYILP